MSSLPGRCAALMTLLASTPSSAADFELGAPVPGLPDRDNTLTIRGARPLAPITLLSGSDVGASPIPGCPGIVTDIDSPEPLAANNTNTSGEVDLIFRAKAVNNNDTLLYQAVDMSNC